MTWTRGQLAMNMAKDVGVNVECPLFEQIGYWAESIREHFFRWPQGASTGSSTLLTIVSGSVVA
jgi:hypothetical protein